MSEQISDEPHQPGAPSDPIEETPAGVEASASLSKTWIAAAAVFMVLPSVIPFYYAVKAEETTITLVLIAFGFGVLVINALILLLVYRWILRMME